MTEGIIIAVIGAAGVVLAALIGSFKKNSNGEKTIKIKQRQEGQNNTQIGVQNNYNSNTTVQFGDAAVDDGTIIIDCGNASGGGGIRYESSMNSNKSGENKDE